MRILLVDDDLKIVEMICMFLQICIPDCQVDTASNTKDALDLIEKNSYAAAIVDWHLKFPETGMDAMISAKSKNIFTIASTGSLEICEMPADMVLRKPYCPNELVKFLLSLGHFKG